MSGLLFERGVRLRNRFRGGGLGGAAEAPSECITGETVIVGGGVFMG